jgi:hypothetical protein
MVRLVPVTKAQVSSSGVAVSARSQCSIRFRQVCHPEMVSLYLVVMVAANTKYSINSFFPPVPKCRFRKAIETDRNHPGAPPFPVYRPDSSIRFRVRTGLVINTGPVAAATFRY